MKEKKFTIYLIFCILIFVLLLFVVLFYSFGYKYSPQNGKLIQTGAIIVKTYPKNANIYVNGKIIKKDISLANLFNDFIKIESLIPDEYNVKITLPKYFTWEKNITVRSEYVTELKNVALLKKNYEKVILSENIETPDLNNMWISNDKNKIVYYKLRNNKKQLFIFDLQNNQEKPLYSLENIFPTKTAIDHKIKDILWSDNDKKLLLDIIISEKDSLAVIDLENNNRVSYMKEGPEEIKNKWNLYFDDLLLYLKDNVLYNVIYPKSDSLKMLNDISGFHVEGSYIYYFKTDDQNLYRNNLYSRDSETPLFQMPDDFNPKLASKITRSDQNTYTVLSSSGKLYFIDGQATIKTVSLEAKYASFTNNSNRILYGNDNEIWVYFIKEKLSQPQKKEFTNELITRFSGNISNIYSFRDEEHLFYKEGGVFKFVELDNRGKRNVFEVADIKNNDVLYREEDNSIIFLESNKLIKASLGDDK